ncbi:serine carboxypeptidase-like 7 [Quercus suber]|uniref:serine carboxypeptidase-like 7 n=1 Tax=Quercus suber TaxID=58331 RepID=UPI0032DF725F
MSTMWLCIVCFLAVANLVAPQSIINSLPGFSGDLPFKLETGYVGVGKSDEVQLFYYFIESERSPEDDPLVLWLTGGAGCSGFSGLVYEMGMYVLNLTHPLYLSLSLSTAQILEPTCQLLSPKPRTRVSKWDPDTLVEDSVDLLRSITHLPEPRAWCREYNYLYSYIWANDKTVQKALRIREGSINEWVRCNLTLANTYDYDVSSSLNYHRNLIKKGYEVLIYSGDHDMVIPYIATHAWIDSLNLTIAHDWRPWFVDGQIAGFTMQYTSKKYCLTFATVKGAGHTAPEYKPNECLAMIDRWLSYYPL